MTIEERDTARAIQTIARKLKEPREVNWEQRRYELIRDFCLKWTSIDDTANDKVMAKIVERAKKAADILIDALKNE